MIRSKFFLSALMGLFLLGGVAQAQEKPDGDKSKTKEREKKDGKAKGIDAKALIAKLTKKYSGFKDYSCTIKQTMKVGPMAINTTTLLKWKAKGKIRTDAERMIPMMGAMKTQVIADGKKANMYQSAPQKTYMDLEQDNPMTLQGDIILLSLLSGNTKLLQDQGMEMKAVEVTEDSVTYERLIFTNPMGITMTYDFKKDDSSIHRSSQLIKIKGMGGENQNDPRAQLFAQGIKVKSKYSAIKVDKGIDDKVFVFKIPEGATKVDPSNMGGGMPGMPGFGGGRKRPNKPVKPKSKPVKPKKDNDEDF
jgi:outer membrane lipoprotein-sorting protein